MMTLGLLKSCFLLKSSRLSTYMYTNFISICSSMISNKHDGNQLDIPHRHTGIDTTRTLYVAQKESTLQGKEIYLVLL
jgi:hypothetical protein